MCMCVLCMLMLMCVVSVYCSKWITDFDMLSIRMDMYECGRVCLCVFAKWQICCVCVLDEFWIIRSARFCFFHRLHGHEKPSDSNRTFKWCAHVLHGLRACVSARACPHLGYVRVRICLWIIVRRWLEVSLPDILHVNTHKYHKKLFLTAVHCFNSQFVMSYTVRVWMCIPLESILVHMWCFPCIH